ncbi:hypothetical protein lerEdw1_015705 [Lerista edwardsae]|nr:hypothetical protein lerEdw1_015705 [Lerista edwardsae]
MLCIFLLLLFSVNVAVSLRICSFNVRSFGEAKRTRPEIVDIIVKVCAHEEIEQIFSGMSQEEYNYVVSKRLGRGTYKEQYAFFYSSLIVSVCVKWPCRPRMVKVKQTYQYPDLQPGDEDALSREPFVTWFSSPQTVAKEFVMIPLHTTPETAVREIDELYDVYLNVKQQWKSENFIFMGDFNAGCGYVAKKYWKTIRLRNHTEFVWLIDDKADTTVRASTHCPYDRIVLRGDRLRNAIVPNSARTFDFQSAYSMTEVQALAVSDHFPVEFQLRMTRRSPRARHRKHLLGQTE